MDACHQNHCTGESLLSMQANKRLQSYRNPKIYSHNLAKPKPTRNIFMLDVMEQKG